MRDEGNGGGWSGDSRTGAARCSERDEKLNILLALLDAYEVLDAYQKRYTLATDLAKKNPDSKRLFEDRASALRGL